MFHKLIPLSFLLLLFASCSNNTSLPKEGEPVLFAEHIAPIIHANCSKCHNSQGAAPFQLITYKDVASKSKLVAYVTSNRIMPPWPADPEYTHFANETYLTNEQISLLNRWVNEGCLPGDTASLETPTILEKKWQSSEPDLIVRMQKPIRVPGNNTDLFMVVKIPFELPKDTFIRAIEFVPGNKRLVHHVNAHIIQFEPSKKSNLFDGNFLVNQDQTKSTTIHKELNLLNDDGSYAPMTPSVCNYLPGAQFSFYPKEIGGYKIGRKNAFYLNDMHFGPSAVDEIDSSYFKIYFGSEPPKRPVSEFQIGTLGLVPVEPKLEVKANEVKTFHITFPVPQDISILTLVPHMHLIGKSFWAYAIKPSGDTIRLIRINNWDFRWQYFYQPKTLLKIPRGSVIYVEGVYDNRAENPNNPFSPPRVIAERNGSMKTTDEMFQLIVTYIPWKKGDEAISME
ncbi:MAG: hypothetical protein CFE21_10380 [Bacteroidetes bacterium B1(2017)]|nr:MAG: hypothetical protein CFE21_10380 [Bacteroidetes bacterium B1(2017)]